MPKRTSKLVSLTVVSRVMAEMGGKIGGKRRLETMTDEERRKVASDAAKARWSKKPKRP